MTNLHILNVQGFNTYVTGILVETLTTHTFLKNIKPHEAIIAEKTNRIGEAFSSGVAQESPIIIGAVDSLFDFFVENCLNQSQFVSQEHIEEQVETLWRPSSSIVASMVEKMEVLQELILIDGHHRYFASMNLLKPDVERLVLLWLVPFRQLQISSFIKIFKLESAFFSANQLLCKGYKKEEPQPRSLSQKNLEIRVSFRGNAYQKRVESEKDFLEEMGFLNTLIEESNLELIELIEAHRHPLPPFGQENCVIQHSLVTHNMVINTVKEEKVFPIHSTCFLPKSKFKKDGNKVLGTYDWNQTTRVYPQGQATQQVFDAQVGETLK